MQQTDLDFRIAMRKEAELARDDGIQRAAEHSGEIWQVQARLSLSLYLVFMPPGETFTAEDLRDYAQVPEPPDRRAWGAVMQTAARAGKIVKAGYREHRDPSRHCGVSTVWRKV